MKTQRKLGIWVVRSEAAPLGKLLADELGGRLYEPWKIAQIEVEDRQRELFRKHFNDNDSWVLVMAVGIAVRFLDGLSGDKLSDPAVVVLDEGCNFAISLLSGHEGGANALAVEAANVVEAQPVITTASESIRPLTIGLGCRKGASAPAIEAAIRLALGERRLEEVRQVVTIDIKRSEPGLVEFCRQHALPLRWLSKQSLQSRAWATQPSAWVKEQIGIDGVCEPCALIASPRGRLIVPKTCIDGVAVAVVEDEALHEKQAGSLRCRAVSEVPNADAKDKHGRLYLVSLGPGSPDHITPGAHAALNKADVIVSYEFYLRAIKDQLAGKEVVTRPLTQERERAIDAIENARAGRSVALVSGGDVGVYAMAAVLFEELEEDDDIEISVIPGVSAANACASLLGSPLSHDFAVLSLSDLLCPWKWIEERARGLAQSGLCVALYNVQSKTRQDGIYKILKIFLDHRSTQTICGVVRNAYRNEQSVEVCKLDELWTRQFDMHTTIIIGNEHTRKKGPWMYTPRGYQGWETERTASVTCSEAGRTPALPGSVACSEAARTSALPGNVDCIPRGAIWVFAGTSDGNYLAGKLKGAPVVVSVATGYGVETASRSCPGAVVTSGPSGAEARYELLRKSRAKYIIDATHPYASKMSIQLIELSRRLDIPYIRFEREPSGYPDTACVCSTTEQAAARAVELGTNIFLSTGSKNLEVFTNAPGACAKNWFVRITPELASIEKAIACGIPRGRICAMQGPFSQSFNEALWRDWNIDCLITKDSGAAGGFPAKLAASAALGINVVVIARPALSYTQVTSSMDVVLEHVNKLGGAV